MKELNTKNEHETLCTTGTENGSTFKHFHAKEEEEKEMNP